MHTSQPFPSKIWLQPRFKPGSSFTHACSTLAMHGPGLLPTDPILLLDTPVTLCFALPWLDTQPTKQYKVTCVRTCAQSGGKAISSTWENPQGEPALNIPWNSAWQNWIILLGVFKASLSGPLWGCLPWLISHYSIEAPWNVMRWWNSIIRWCGRSCREKDMQIILRFHKMGCEELKGVVLRVAFP